MSEYRVYHCESVQPAVVDTGMGKRLVVCRSCLLAWLACVPADEEQT